ncbi:MAG TPA: diguanylate cyclase [Bacillota bacterium]|nr:diguanylate cyclase [Bacillota bacterium]
MLKSDLCIDPFTGLSNLFGLFESSGKGAFDQAGVIVAIDIAYLKDTSKNYSLKITEDCVRALAGLMRNLICRQSPDVTEEAFRIGEDEFVLVFPGKTVNEAQGIALELKSKFREIITNSGILGAGLCTAVVQYEERGMSAASILKASYLALRDSLPTADMPVELPEWAEGLIDNMATRICETLSLLRQTRDLALSDEVSGLPNYRAAKLFLEEAVLGFHQSQQPYSILLIDGDDLKRYNNLSYQHGNRMIRELGQLLVSSLRYGDQIARWLSGDEFIVVIPNSDRQMAFQVGERLRNAVERGTRSWSYPITISIGVASCPADGTKVEELLARAEAANNMAKRAGKNQVS